MDKVVCFFSPLEQFEIYNFWCIPNIFFLTTLSFFGLVGKSFYIVIYSYWFNFFLITGFVSFFIFYFFIMFYAFCDFKNLQWTWIYFLRNDFLKFVWNLLISNLLYVYFDYFFFVFCIFGIIFFSNLFGLLPYTYTTTSHILFTFLISFSAFVLINFVGIRKQGINFFSLFLPSGAPLIIAPFLVLVEIISYVARVFSLAIRLFANLMSGHTLLKILAGFIWVMILSGSIAYLFFFIPALIVFIVTGLELAIAALQAYVFTVLVIIYFNDVLVFH